MLTSFLRSLVPFTATPAHRLRKSFGVGSRVGVPAIVVWVMMSCTVQAQGTWTQLTTNNPAGGSGSMLLLTDGTVIVQGPGVSKDWTKLTPDASGNYINGTWSSIAAMSLERLYTGSVVMPNGKVFILGGEYTGPTGAATWVNSGEIYDPVANAWTPTAPFPKSNFGDGQAILLSSGKIFAGYLSGPQTYLYTPSTDTWAATGSKIRNDRNNEETWLLLPGGGVLCYDIFSSPATGPGFAQRYNTSSGTWVDAGSVPVPLSSSSLGFEMGPAGLLPDGRAIQIGANNNTAIYRPTTNTWAAGPTLPAGLGGDDTPGAILPDGRFLFAVDTSVPNFTPPTKLYSFDYTTDTLTDVTPGGLLGSDLATSPGYVARMLVLPNGHMLFNNGRGRIWDYAPAGSPQASWKPTITNVAKTGATAYTLTGARLTGISEGANYGDDAGLSTNYPIVRLTSSTGVVRYLTTFNWTPGVSTAGNTALTTVQFTLPTGLANGNYQFATIANGIASVSAQATIANNVLTVSTGAFGGNVVASYNTGTKTLTLTGDVNSNAVSVTYKSATNTIEVAGLNGTKVNNKTTIQTYSHSSALKLNLGAVMSDGDDSVYLIGVNASLVYLNLGNGNDNAGLSMCSVVKLQVDGGLGTNTLVTTTSTIPAVGPNRILKNVILVP